DYLTYPMQAFIARQSMVFVASSGEHGTCDCSFRAGPPGFVRILDWYTLTYPEYRGNGVFASAANVQSNPHAALLFMDFEVGKVGLHVNGSAQTMTNAQMTQNPAVTPQVLGDIEDPGGRHPELWVVVAVEEAYIHCSKHVPVMRRRLGRPDVPWGTDDEGAKG